MLKIGEFFMIRELHQKGWTKTAIAEETGFDRKTVSKYINNDQIPRSSKRKDKESKLESYKLYVLQRIQEGTTNCMVLFEEIQAMGYEGKTTILREFVKPYRVQPKRQATVRFETPPGKQAQMDWADVGMYEVNGNLQKVYAFIMILSYSRMKYVEFTTDMKLETLMKCHMNAFAYFNGLPEQILYDNMKTVVTKHSPVEIRFNRTFEDFLAYYGIVPKACKPHRPQTKGKVERTVLYLKNNFFQRKHEPTLYALNHNIRKWLDNTANQKKNQTTNEPPVQRLQHEQKFLQTWGTKSLFPTSHWELREVSRDCFISYLGKKYSVPFRYAAQKVKVKVTLDHQIEIYDEQECIAQHPILTGKTNVHINLKHYEGLHKIDKEQERKNPSGFAAKDSLHNPAPLVEERSLASYAALEEGDSIMKNQLEKQLEDLGWQATANQLDDLLENASKNNVSYFDFLHTVVLKETEARESNFLSKRMKRAKLPFTKTIYDFDYSFQPSVSEQRVKETLTCRFIANGENRILLGPPGVGKTHLAISFAIEALTQGYTALFLTADEVVLECRKAESKGGLHRLVNKWSRPDLLIVDEVGYFPFDELTANIFFQVVSKRYENGALILTSNKSYMEWGKVFGDDVLATAILDHLLHHSVTFNIKGESFRLKEKKKAGVIPSKMTDNR